MTNRPIVRVARLTLLLALAAGTCSTVAFFDDPNPHVALAALATWCCFLVAIWKAPRP